MGSRRNLKVEGVVYLFRLKSYSQKHSARDVIEKALKNSKCGHVIASGTSLFDGGTYSIEIVTSAQTKAEDTISRVCERNGLTDYEIVWD